MQSDLPKEEKEEVLVEWKAPLRVTVPKSREYTITLVAIISVVALVLFLAEGVMPVILIGALFFLYWNLQRLPQHDAVYKLTSLGIHLENLSYPWTTFTNFWEEKRGGFQVFVLGHNLNGSRTTLFVAPDSKEKAESVLAGKLKGEALPPTSAEKLMGFVSSKLPQ